MLRGLFVAAALAVGSLAFGSVGASAAPAAGGLTNSPLPQMSLIEKTQARYCRRWYRECRARWGGGPQFRRCLRRHGC